VGIVDHSVRAPAYQILADGLRAQITSGELRAGDRLPTEPQLCVRSGLSRSTVREALRLLASQHLIITTRGVTGGSFVAHPRPDQIADTLSTGVQLLISNATVGTAELFEVRRLLEVPAAGLAAQRRTEQHLTELTAAMFDPANDSLERKLDAHRQFHSTIVAATGNALYEMMAIPLYNLTNERELGEMAPHGFWSRVDLEHRELLAHVEAGDAAAASSIARTHVEYLTDVYVGAATAAN
jgi:DNA-binding FadR family transcriptional regulator